MHYRFPRSGQTIKADAYCAELRTMIATCSDTALTHESIFTIIAQ
ncbi:hypothetical protein F3H15_34860 [Pseudomonas aeruginosa]|nr:hypothetical protein F3H15_34860 [Pseudomonas aeruginosa]